MAPSDNEEGPSKYRHLPVYVALASVANLDKVMAPFGPGLGPPVLIWDAEVEINRAFGRHRYRLREGRKECIKHDGNDLETLNDHLPYQITKHGDNYEARHELQFQNRWLRYRLGDHPNRLVRLDGIKTSICKVNDLDLEATKDPESVLVRGIWRDRPRDHRGQSDKHWTALWKTLIGSAPPNYYVMSLEIDE